MGIQRRVLAMRNTHWDFVSVSIVGALFGFLLWLVLIIESLIRCGWHGCGGNVGAVEYGLFFGGGALMLQCLCALATEL